MLNYRKIRIMHKLAVYENKEGKEDIQLSKYYKTDYVRYQVLKSIICATVELCIDPIVIFLYQSEYLVRNSSEFGLQNHWIIYFRNIYYYYNYLRV